MKKLICTILTSAATLAFGQDPIVVEYNNSMPPLPSEEISTSKSGFFYVRFATGERDLARLDSVLPGFGLGYRRLAGDGAIDISTSGILREQGKGGQAFWTLPKVSYVHYLDPSSERSLYLGGGLGWGGVVAPGHKFTGIISNATVGYEFMRHTAFLGFTEFTLSQPAIPLSEKGGFPGPAAELSVGVGF